MMLYMSCSSEVIIHFLMQNFSFIVSLTQYLGRGGVSLWFDLGFEGEHLQTSVSKFPYYTHFL